MCRCAKRDRLCEWVRKSRWLREKDGVDTHWKYWNSTKHGDSASDSKGCNSFKINIILFDSKTWASGHDSIGHPWSLEWQQEIPISTFFQGVRRHLWRNNILIKPWLINLNLIRDAFVGACCLSCNVLLRIPGRTFSAQPCESKAIGKVESFLLQGA